MVKVKEPEPLFNDRDKYEYLIKARNFHYENFRKGLSYFYVAIAALFVAYYSVVKEKKFDNQNMLELLILILGYLVSLFWYWSSKGYYYWNINFITLVNRYEEKVFDWPITERVYSVFANKKTQNKYWHPVGGANISTSKVAILFGYTVSLFWGFLLSFKLLDSFLQIRFLQWACPMIHLVCSAAVIWLLSITFARFLLYSKIDHMPDLEYQQESLNQ